MRKVVVIVFVLGALAMDPSRAVAYLNLGDAQAKLEHHDKAREAYRTYLELNTNGPAAQYARDQIGRIGG